MRARNIGHVSEVLRARARPIGIGRAIGPGLLLLLGDFNYPNINWEKLYVSHSCEHCASKFFTATQNSFLHQHVSTETHSQPNQRSTLIDLIFTSDNQSITNLIYALPLGKSHHKILKFNYLIKWSLNHDKIITCIMQRILTI